MDFNFEPGTKLLVELTDREVYEGEYVSGDNNRITLINVSQYPDKEIQPFPSHFYRMEIETVRPMQNNLPEKPVCDGMSIKTTLTVNDSYMDKYKDLISNNIFISDIDEAYHKSVRRLKYSDIISVAGMGSRFGRYAKISFIAFANKNQVFIFDVKQIGDAVFDLGLRQILESDDILKVVHNSKSLADCLEHCHKVELANVFDTQIADLLLYKKENSKLPEKMRKFSECVNSYLNIPKSVIDRTEMSSKTLLERPMCDEVRSNVSMLVVYLLAIKRVTESKMFEDFNQCVQCYLGVMKDADPVIARQLNNDMIPKALQDM